MANIGGQAVMEGVMMKNGQKIAVAVRREDNSIIIKKFKLKFKECKILFLRGIVNLFIMLFVGFKAINWSGFVAMGEDEKISSFWSFLSGLLAIALAIFLFKFLPLGVASLFEKWFDVHYFVFNIIDGFVKVLIFVLYVYFIGLFKDIFRLFQYHGAEHKVVNCHEARKKLTVKNCKKFSTVHNRCGTTFIFLVLLLSIFIYTLIPSSFSFSWKLVLRLILLPLVVAISYEVLYLGAKFKNNLLLRILVYPGLLIQKLTTKEPSDDQVKVAIKSLKEVL